MRQWTTFFGAMLVVGVVASGANAQAPQEDEETLEQLGDRIDILAEEIERIRSGESEPSMTAEEARQAGLGGPDQSRRTVPGSQASPR